ncbi:MAG: hypothetical protein RLZZ281_1126 [Pseudomonadota bacterium]|jgi:hypothetical protein
MENQQLIELIDQSTPYMVGVLILFMVMIVLQLARESKGGRMAYIVLAIALLVGTSGWIAKTVIQYFLDI